MESRLIIQGRSFSPASTVLSRELGFGRGLSQQKDERADELAEVQQPTTLASIRREFARQGVPFVSDRFNASDRMDTSALDEICLSRSNTAFSELNSSGDTETLIGVALLAMVIDRFGDYRRPRSGAIGRG
jgi:hypothetical protein